MEYYDFSFKWLKTLQWNKNVNDWCVTIWALISGFTSCTWTHHDIHVNIHALCHIKQSHVCVYELHLNAPWSQTRSDTKTCEYSGTNMSQSGQLNSHSPISQISCIPVDLGTWWGRGRSWLQAEGRMAEATAAVVALATEKQVGLRRGRGWRSGHLIGGDGDLRRRWRDEYLEQKI